MSEHTAQLSATHRKILKQEKLDDGDIAIIDRALVREIQQESTPFERHRDHFIIGSERFKALEGHDFYRTVLMAGNQPLSVIQVFNGLVRDRNTHPSFGVEYGYSRQSIIDEDTVKSLREYVAMLIANGSDTARDLEDQVETYLGEYIGRDGSITLSLPEVLEQFLERQSYRNNLRAFPRTPHRLADIVRKSCAYALKKLRERGPVCTDIADHLQEFVKIGVTSHYSGNRKWKF